MRKVYIILESSGVDSADIILSVHLSLESAHLTLLDLIEDAGHDYKVEKKTEVYHLSAYCDKVSHGYFIIDRDLED